MSIVIYSKNDCPWCDKAKALMTEKDEHFYEIVIGSDITREEFVEKFPEVNTVPYCIVGSVVLPSYESLEEYLNHPVRKSAVNF